MADARVRSLGPENIALYAMVSEEDHDVVYGFRG